MVELRNFFNKYMKNANMRKVQGINLLTEKQRIGELWGSVYYFEWYFDWFRYNLRITMIRCHSKFGTSDNWYFAGLYFVFLLKGFSAERGLQNFQDRISWTSWLNLGYFRLSPEDFRTKLRALNQRFVETFLNLFQISFTVIIHFWTAFQISPVVSWTFWNSSWAPWRIFQKISSDLVSSFSRIYLCSGS